MVQVKAASTRGFPWRTALALLLVAGVLLAVSLSQIAATSSYYDSLESLTELYNGRFSNNDRVSYVPISCTELKQQSLQKQFRDPNAGHPLNTTSTWTKTDPTFAIALHVKYFDNLRWSSIMNKGEYYETGITRQFKDILYIKPKGLVVDVGMNIGWFTLWSAALGHDVVSFEPNPVNILRVCESIQLNQEKDFEASIRVYQYGMSDQQGNMTLTWGKNPGMATFHADRLAKKTEKTTTEVKVTTLDDFASEAGWLNNSTLIHLLKVDVEGHEINVFRGAKSLIESGVISNVLFEYSGNNKEELKEMIVMLLKGSYSLYFIGDYNGRGRLHRSVQKLGELSIESDYETQLASLDADLDDIVKTSVNMWWRNKKEAVTG